MEVDNNVNRVSRIHVYYCINVMVVHIEYLKCTCCRLRHYVSYVGSAAMLYLVYRPVGRNYNCVHVMYTQYTQLQRAIVLLYTL